MGVSADGIRRLLDESGVGEESRGKVWSIVMKGGKESVSREEFNVLLALVGLAQEGDEVTIDGVDDRRRGELFLFLPFFIYFNSPSADVPQDLPIPTLSGSRYPRPSLQAIETPTTSIASSYNQSAFPPTHHAQEHPMPSTPIKVVHRQQSTPISTAPTRPRNTANLFGTESDPWGSPVMHVDHDHVNEPVNPGAAAENTRQPTPPMERDSSFDYTPSASTLGMPPTESAIGGRTYSRHPQQPPPQTGDDEDEPDDIHSALRQSDASHTSSWGIYDGPRRPDSFGGSTYTQPAAFGEQVNPGIGQRHGSFGGLGGNNANGSGPAITASDGARLGRMRIPRGPEETITVNILPEKEGMFMFQHRNYQIGSTRRGSRVVRRYSDFVWYVFPLFEWV
jgi:sorting nexin-8